MKVQLTVHLLSAPLSIPSSTTTTHFTTVS